MLLDYVLNVNRYFCTMSASLLKGIVLSLWGQGMFFIFIFCVLIGVLLNRMVERSLLTEDKFLTAKELHSSSYHSART